MEPHVTTLDDDAGLSLYDPIEAARFVLYTDREVEPRPTDPDRFPFPVESAVSIAASELVVPKRDAIHVRSLNGHHRDKFHGRDGERYCVDGDRLLDVSSTAMKLYLAVPGPFEVVADSATRNTTISLPKTRELVVGVRSFHERPAHTIETPTEPEPVMRALSTTGSALKTLSVERSFPTMRGHPPAFEPADELSIPDEIEPPASSVDIWVPPRWEFVYPVAPLAYYLGATVRPGSPPCIEVGDWSYSLGGPGVDPDRFQQRVIRALQQVFFMDCLVRTEGLHPVDLHERHALADALELDFRALYDSPLATQIRTFLDLSYETISGYLPKWHLCVDVEPTADHVAALPYLLDDLSIIRCPQRHEPADPDPEVDLALAEFARSTDGTFVRASDRSEDARTSDREPIEGMFTPEAVPAMEYAYLGDGLPFRRNKASLEALERRLTYDRPTADSIGVKIVCNDEMMAEEATVEEYYGVHDVVQYSVDVKYELTRDELASVLQEDVDLLHYIGHIDEQGFACTDGHFDAHEMDEVGVDTFLLNACNSYDQGQALLGGGARAGVTSFTQVSNKQANRLGRTMARALNAGFTLRSALALTAIDSSAVHYIVLGDGGRQLVQSQSGVPYLADVVNADLDAGEVTVDLFAFPASSRGQGTLWTPSLTNQAPDYLVFGHINRFTASVDQLMEYLSVQSFPLTADGQLYWSNELDREKTTAVLTEIAELGTGVRTPTRIGDFFRPLRGE